MALISGALSVVDGLNLRQSTRLCSSLRSDFGFGTDPL